MEQTRLSGVPLDGEKIRKHRLKLGISQEEAAGRAGLAGRQKWNALERGRVKDPRLSTVERIADALGCRPADLLK